MGRDLNRTEAAHPSQCSPCFCCTPHLYHGALHHPRHAPSSQSLQSSKGRDAGKPSIQMYFLLWKIQLPKKTMRSAMLSLGVLTCSLIRLLWLYASQQGCFYPTDGSQLPKQSSCSCSGVHPPNGFQGLVHITVMGSLQGLSPAGEPPAPGVCFSFPSLAAELLRALWARVSSGSFSWLCFQGLYLLYGM